MKSCEGSGYLTTIEGSGSFRTWSSTDSLHICMQWASTVLILQVCIDSQYIHRCYNSIETVLIDTHHTRYIWSEVQLFDPSTFFTRLHLTTPRMHVSTHPPLCSPLQYLCTIYWLDPTTSSVLFSHTSMTTFPSHPTMCDSWHLQDVNANDRKACHANLIQLRESTEEEDLHTRDSMRSHTTLTIDSQSTHATTSTDVTLTCSITHAVPYHSSGGVAQATCTILHSYYTSVTWTIILQRSCDISDISSWQRHIPHIHIVCRMVV